MYFWITPFAIPVVWGIIIFSIFKANLLSLVVFLPFLVGIIGLTILIGHRRLKIAKEFEKRINEQS